MVRRRDEIASQGIHLRQRANHAGVAEVIGIHTPRQARAGSRFHGNDLIVRFSAQLLAHKRRDQSSQVGAAAGTTDNHVRLDPVLVQCGLGLQADHGLVQNHLIEYAPEDIAVAGGRNCHFDRFGDGAAERASGSRMCRQDLPPHLRGLGWGGYHRCAVGAHHLTAEGLLLIAHLDHVHLAVQAEIAAGHGKRGAPLARSGLCSDALQALLLCIISLGNGGIQLMAAAGVVSFKLVVNLRRGLELFFQAIRPDQRRGTIHLIKIPDLLRNLDISVFVIQFLPHQFLAEYSAELFGRHGLMGTGIEQRCRFVLHIRPDVIPALRHLTFFQIDFVRDLFFCHGKGSFLMGLPAPVFGN